MTYKDYIISFLLDDITNNLTQLVFYGEKVFAPENAKIVIVPSSFFDNGIYGTRATLPRTPFRMLPNTDIPFLFGEPRLEYTSDGKLILYADLVASAYFMLSRYEEIIKPECRDQLGRFLAKDSVVFQQGYGMRPLVDEWGRYLRGLLRQAGVSVPEEKHGFKKIYLTHDIDRPFFLRTPVNLAGQILRNLQKKGIQIHNPLKAYLTGKNDPYNTFSWIIEQDNRLIKKLGSDIVQVIYFIISGKSNKNNKYHSVKTLKYKKMLSLLVMNKAKLGLHVSHEGGINPLLISEEIKRLPSCVDCNDLYSRNHYLRWREPEQIEQIENAGIKHDFTLGYADCIGFRVGTCHPYRFINPKTKTLADVIIHPMQIMEGTLDEKQYMGLSEDRAFDECKKLISEVYKHNGEFVLLFHNSSFIPESYHVSLYKRILNFCSELQ